MKRYITGLSIVTLCGILGLLVAVNVTVYRITPAEPLTAAEAKTEATQSEYIQGQQITAEKVAAIEAEQIVDLGEFTLTAYCNCAECCGKWSGGATASGVMPESGVTVAVDKSLIPLGSTVLISGYGDFVAQDTGSAIKGKRIDVYMDNHDDALQFGRRTAAVKVVSE